MFRFVLALILLPAVLHAGAWPRGEGSGFISVSQGFTFADDDRSRIGPMAAYAEFGLTPRLTFGTKLDHFDRAGEAFVFLRRHLSRPDAAWQLALQLDLGQTETDIDMAVSAFGVGGHLGRGLTTPWGPGWIEAEIRRNSRIDGGFARTNLDLTVGITPREHTHVIVQGRLYSDGTDESFELAPSYVRPFIGPSQVRIGVAGQTSGDAPLRLELGSWLAF
ncbi:hypothetical protein E2L08_07740 [Palleronia sediminis]|uniref:Uncharacterized protein n=1 Tax=Palleronia sediminis TaxID=2547833 RepID=A0A4R6A9V1_9RHOB|nr:hypothetical protein [Palleronia sediminis]TDL79777.1 hypothetical protein E2L08_07740 [Palleronia sediminis]